MSDNSSSSSDSNTVLDLWSTDRSSETGSKESNNEEKKPEIGLAPVGTDENSTQHIPRSLHLRWLAWRDAIFSIIALVIALQVINLLDVATNVLRDMPRLLTPERNVTSLKDVVFWVIFFTGLFSVGKYIKAYMMGKTPICHAQNAASSSASVEHTNQLDISFNSRSYQSHTQGRQDINNNLLDILHKLLTEPVVRQHRQYILCIWQVVKDLPLYSNIAFDVELKIIKLAQMTVEIFAEDKAILDIAISVLHNRLCVGHEKFQDVGDVFLRNLVDFCCRDKTESKWKAFEILIFHLHICNGIMYRPVFHDRVIPVLKNILLSVNINETKHVTLSNFSLYKVWLHSSNTDVVQWYAAYAIYQLINTKEDEIHSFILHSVDISHFKQVLNKLSY